MNAGGMAEERAKELIEEARKADAEADLMRAPIQDQSDKKARYHRAKTLQNAQVLNIEAAQSLVKARKLAGMVKELKESAKAVGKPLPLKRFCRAAIGATVCCLGCWACS